MLHPDIRGNGPCNGCGTGNNIIWHTSNQFWNHIASPTGTPADDITDDPGGILCVACFAERAHDKGIHPIGWALIAEAKCPTCDRVYWQVDPADTHCPYCILRHAHK